MGGFGGLEPFSSPLVIAEEKSVGFGGLECYVLVRRRSIFFSALLLGESRKSSATLAFEGRVLL